ncbi:SseB family protein [Gemmobacter serpentinus]|uniref:SseB family protein n=1 Tax=Gemmobacter serpentinus TaxID=2652247 RepID=UPI00124DF79D|nr:SseB family protein [Gemmobacter serpentinus]
MTPLDLAYEAMAAARDGDDTPRLQFYERLADGEMILMLETEAEGGNLTPRVFDLEDGPVVLIFDNEERLGAFTGIPVPYAALPGRVIAGLLAGQGIGLGINLGVAPSSMLLPPFAVDWLAETLAHGPEATEALPERFEIPRALPAALIAGLEAKLARAGGLAAHALLAAVHYRDGRQGHMLAFIDATPGAQEALARAAAEALTFSGIEAGEMDVTFLAGSEPAAEAMAQVGRRFELPVQVADAPPAPAAPQGPGMNPDKPPRLR